MSNPKTEEIKIRVPTALKRAVKAIAAGRYTSESEIVREAIISYLGSRAPGASGTMRDAPDGPNTPAVPPHQTDTTYLKRRRKKP